MTLRPTLFLGALVLLTGCYTYKHSEFFRPEGPGKTVRDFDSVPRVQEISPTAGLTIQLRALRKDMTLQADLRLEVHYGHTARFQAPMLGFRCGDEAYQSLAIPTGTEGGARDGIGFNAPHAPEQPFPGAGYERHIPRHGNVSYGSYSFVVELPSCAASGFSIRVPPVEIDGSPQSIDSVTFHSDSGRFLVTIPIA